MVDIWVWWHQSYKLKNITFLRRRLLHYNKLICIIMNSDMLRYSRDVSASALKKKKKRQSTTSLISFPFRFNWKQRRRRCCVPPACPLQPPVMRLPATPPLCAPSLCHLFVDCWHVVCVLFLLSVFFMHSTTLRRSSASPRQFQYVLLPPRAPPPALLSPRFHSVSCIVTRPSHLPPPPHSLALLGPALRQLWDFLVA